MKSQAFRTVGYIHGFLIACCGVLLAAPSITSVEVDPDPLEVGKLFSVTVTASGDTVQVMSLLDLRPAVRRVERLTHVKENGVWVASGTLPDGVGLEDGDYASIRTYAFASDRTRDQEVKAIPIVVTPSLDLVVQSGSDFISLVQGNSSSVATVISLTNETGGAVNVINTVTIIPDTGGITTTSDYPGGGFVAPVSTDFVLNQSFQGLVPGTYTVTNTAQIVGTTVTAADAITVQVLPPGGDPVIEPLGAYPSGVVLNTPTQVMFTASVTNFLSPPTLVQLRQVDGVTNPVVGPMTDDGLNGDLQADDGVFTGVFEITAFDEETLEFVASGIFPGVTGERFSSIFPVTVSPLPVIVAPSDPQKFVENPIGGGELVCDEVVLIVEPGTDSARVEELAALVNGTVVGAIPILNTYQIRIDNPGCDPAIVAAAISTLEGEADVVGVTANTIGEIDEVTPNDPRFGEQYAPALIRADEAWVISRGAPLVAVIDTGVDYNHPDLTGRVIKGYDYVNGDSDPMDDHSHGTHVAGIACAPGNNSTGIAGIAWNSKVLAYKVFDSAGKGTRLNCTAAIVAAANSGAKVINLSCAWSSDPVKLLWLGVTYASAKGSLVVCAAGNEGDSAVRYPAGYSSVVCVGNTTATDTRNSLSSYGPHVDIAAPGTSILSTVLSNGYDLKSGTSMAAPCVSGCAAVVWSRFPSWSAGQVRARLLNTAKPLASSLQLGAGRVDLFEAVFNGSFEDGLVGWSTDGTAGSIDKLGPIVPQDREFMAFASSGPDSSQIQTILDQTFPIQSDVGGIPLQFDYNFVTEEYPEWVGSIFNDKMRVTLITPSGSMIDLATEEVNSSAFTSVGGIDFPGGDSTVGQTGWKTVGSTIPVTGGNGVYRIIVRDEGDGIYDSNVLIDNIRFKAD